MADEATPAALFNKTFTAVLTLLVFISLSALIVRLIFWGDGASKMHTDALAWAFTVNGAILAALGIGNWTPTLISAFTKR